MKTNSIPTTGKTKAMNTFFNRAGKVWVAIILVALLAIKSESQNLNSSNKVCPMGVEVNTRTGNLFFVRSDIFIPGRQLDIDISFAYNSYEYKRSSPYGNGWSFAYDMKYRIDSADNVVVSWGSGRDDTYKKGEGNEYIAPVGFFDSLSQYQPGKFRLHTSEGLEFYFDNAANKRLTKVEEPNGNFLTMTYNDTLLTAITNNSGQSVTLAYINGKLTGVTDANASPTLTFTYEYDAYGNLIKVTDPLNASWQFSYMVNGPMATLKDKNANVADLIYYPDFSTREVISCNSRVGFSYDQVMHTTTVTDFVPTGENQVTTYVYDENGWLTRLSGACCGVNVTFSYDNSGNLLQRTDANGNSWKYTYDNRGNYLTVTDPMNNVTTLNYTNDFNQISGITDPLGNSYTLTYDAAGNPLQITRPDGSNMTNTYAANGDIQTIKDPRGNIIYFTYDANGYPEKVTLPPGTESQMTYDARGNLITETDPNGNTLTYTYDKMNRTTEVHHPLGRSVKMDYDKSGNLIAVTDPKGYKQTYSFDASDRMVKIEDAKGNYLTGTYDAMNNLTSYTDRRGTSTIYDYDKQNRLIQLTDQEGNKVNFEYDPVGNMTSIVLQNGETLNYIYDKLDRMVESSDVIGSFGQFTYDKNGNISSFTNNGGATTTFNYDNLNRLTKVIDPVGNSRVFTYDSNDNLLTLKDRNGNVSSIAYNALDRTTSFTDNNGNSILAEYDPNGNIIKATDQNGNETLYEFDQADRLTKMTYADGSYEQYAYDANNNVVQKKLSDGSVIEFTYDELNRPVTKLFHNGNLLGFTYNENGQLLSASNDAGTISYTFDGLGRVTSETFDGKTTAYSYDIIAGTVTITYPNGMTVIKKADKRGRLKDVVIDGQNVLTNQYDALDRLTKKTYNNGVETNYQYNSLDQLTAMSSNIAGLPALTFQYDKESNKTAIRRDNDPAYSETFEYDNAYRLIDYKQGVLNGGAITSPAIHNSYTYDAVGNRVAASLNGVNTLYSVNNLNQYTAAGGVTFSYDGRGNRTFDGNFHTLYDAAGRKLTDSAAGVVYHYVYDALGRRVKKSNNGIVKNYYYSGDQQIMETEDENTGEKAMVFENPFSPLVRFTENKIYYSHLNQLLSTEAVTDEAGNIQEKYRYEDFGKPSFIDASGNVLSSSNINNRFLYTGHEYDGHTRDYQTHFRNYDPSNGVFNQRDPIGTADQMGLYQYVGNNPVNTIDLMGLFGGPYWQNVVTGGKKAFSVFKKVKGVVTPYAGMFLIKYNIDKFTDGIIKLFDPCATGGQKVNAGFNAVGGAVGTGTGLYYAGNFASNIFNGFKGGTGLINRIGNGIAAGVRGAPGVFAEAELTSTLIRTPGTIYYGTETALAGSASVAGFASATAGGLFIYKGVDIGWKYGTGTGMSLAESAEQDWFEVELFGFTEITTLLSGGYAAQKSELEMRRSFSEDPDARQKYEAARAKVEGRGSYEKRWSAKNHMSVKNGCSSDAGSQSDAPGKQAPGTTGSTHVVITNDPNAIIGPDGVGDHKWASVNDRLPYQIQFENDTMATAPVKYVKVTYPIDAKQDGNTFQLGSFGFNGIDFTVPAGLNSYYQRLDVRDSLGIFVDLTAGYDGVNHEAFWIFQTIDPRTLLPTADPMKGLLLTSDNSKPTDGTGYVNFTIKPVSSARTGDTTHAYASIVFDDNDSMHTNTVWNIIDAFPPTTRMSSVATEVEPGQFRIEWSGQDDEGGSGIAGYSLFVSVNGKPFSLYLSNITETSTVFTGVPDSIYCFFIAGVDSVKNQEPLGNLCQISFKPAGSAVPLTWLDFNGSRKNDDVLLIWSTSNEINTKLFMVERSLNGTDFRTVASVPAHKNGAFVNNYEYTDRNVVSLNADVLYYRLRQVDEDGHYAYSKVIRVKADKQANQPIITVVPNPFDRYISLKVVPANDWDKTNMIELYSLQGTLLYRKQINQSGSFSVTIHDLPFLSSGIYILKTTINGSPYVHKLMKH